MPVSAHLRNASTATAQKNVKSWLAKFPSSAPSCSSAPGYNNNNNNNDNNKHTHINHNNTYTTDSDANNDNTNNHSNNTANTTNATNDDTSTRRGKAPATRRWARSPCRPRNYTIHINNSKNYGSIAL